MNELRGLVLIGAANLVGRSRALSTLEIAELYRALRLVGPKRRTWSWTKDEDRRLRLLFKKRGFALQPKPFQRNGEIRLIAESMGRSYEAVLKRLQRLRRDMRDCPNASGRLRG